MTTEPESDAPRTDPAFHGLRLGAEALTSTAGDASEEDRRDALLRYLWKPTPDEYISKLPRYAGRRDTSKANRERGKCQECGNFHELPAIHLDYCGHSDTTRLIAEVDPEWQWCLSPEQALLWGHYTEVPDPETGGVKWVGTPVVYDSKGYPSRIFIELTVLGITRPGIGTVEPGKSDPEKELIGDAIRNSALRFGVAADLWSKAPHGELDDTGGSPPKVGKQESDKDADAVYRELGWGSKVDHDLARDQVVDRSATLNDSQKMAFRTWRAGKGWRFTDELAPAVYEAMHAAIERIENGEPPEPPEPPSTVAEAPAGADSGPSQGVGEGEDLADADAGQQADTQGAEESGGEGDQNERVEPCPECVDGKHRRLNPECWACKGQGVVDGVDPERTPNDQPCALCASTRSNRVEVRGVVRCEKPDACRNRAIFDTSDEGTGIG